MVLVCDGFYFCFKNNKSSYFHTIITPPMNNLGENTYVSSPQWYKDVCYKIGILEVFCGDIIYQIYSIMRQ